MPRIVLPIDTLVGKSLLHLSQQVIGAQQSAGRLKAIVDQITNNGTTTVALENNAESGMPPGSGATLYTALNQIKTALDGLSSTMSAIDRG